MKFNHLGLLMIVLFTLTIAACGGEGSGGETSAPLLADQVEVTDTDGDGVANELDAFPDDPFEWRDNDGDGIGNNVDTDVNGDGLDDVISEVISPSGLRHPGVLQSASEINALAAALAQDDPYRQSLWTDMMGNARGRIDKTDWIPPLDLVDTNFHSPLKFAGAGLIRYVNDWVINGTPSSEESAITILNQWAEIRSFTPTGDTHKLVGGIFAGYLAHAAELLLCTDTNWPLEEQQAFKQMIRNIFVPMVNEDRMIGFNGNWDLAATWSAMAMAVLLDDKPLFDEQIEHLRTGWTNARISHYILDSGQNQESHRDQMHAGMGLTFLLMASQIAWTQGIDLYETDNRSVGKAFEHYAAWNLGEGDVPFQLYPCPVGSNSAHDYNTTMSVPGDVPRVFEIVYHHYLNYRGIELPFTKEVLDNITHPEGPGGNWSSHASAIYWDLDLSVDAAQRQAAPADVALNINPDYQGRSYLRVNAGGDHYVAMDGRAFTRSGWWASTSGTRTESHTQPIDGTEDDALYQSYRRTHNASMGYSINIPDGEYLLTLHFAEHLHDSVGQRVFDVSVEEQQLLDDFDIYAAAGKNRAYTHQQVITLTDGTLNISLDAEVGYALLNGIECEPYLP
jgi:hypothetical protein